MGNGFTAGVGQAAAAPRRAAAQPVLTVFASAAAESAHVAESEFLCHGWRNWVFGYVDKVWLKQENHNGNWNIMELHFITSNGGFHKWRYPKWIVYNGKSCQNACFEGTLILGNFHVKLKCG